MKKTGTAKIKMPFGLAALLDLLLSYERGLNFQREAKARFSLLCSPVRGQVCLLGISLPLKSWNRGTKRKVTFLLPEWKKACDSPEPASWGNIYREISLMMREVMNLNV